MSNHGWQVLPEGFRDRVPMALAATKSPARSLFMAGRFCDEAFLFVLAQMLMLIGRDRPEWQRKILIRRWQNSNAWSEKCGALPSRRYEESERALRRWKFEV